LKKDIKHYRDEFEDEWSLIFNCLKTNGYTKEYPGIDDPEKEPELKRLFTKSFVSVVTRCFGWGLPRTSMIPFADCINHHNVDSTYELIHKTYHLAGEDEADRGPASYYSQSKMEGDYTDFLNDDDDGYQCDTDDLDPASQEQHPLDHPSVTTRPFPMRRPVYPRTQT
jgi:hypothetical protein